jgi:hypothetical protein
MIICQAGRVLGGATLQHAHGKLWSCTNCAWCLSSGWQSTQIEPGFWREPMGKTGKRKEHRGTVMATLLVFLWTKAGYHLTFQGTSEEKIDTFNGLCFKSQDPTCHRLTDRRYLYFSQRLVAWQLTLSSPDAISMFGEIVTCSVTQVVFISAERRTWPCSAWDDLWLSYLILCRQIMIHKSANHRNMSVT